MIFNTLSFAIFAAIFFIPYFILSHRAQLLWLLGASYFFYAWWDWRFCFLMIFCAIANYIFGLLLTNQRLEKRRRLVLYRLAIAFNLTVLGIFKYYEFFLDSFLSLLGKLGIHVPEPSLKIILPIGISFYTFHSLSYIIDI